MLVKRAATREDNNNNNNVTSTVPKFLERNGSGVELRKLA